MVKVFFLLVLIVISAFSEIKSNNVGEKILSMQVCTNKSQDRLVVFTQNTFEKNYVLYVDDWNRLEEGDYFILEVDAKYASDFYGIRKIEKHMSKNSLHYFSRIYASISCKPVTKSEILNKMSNKNGL